MDVNEKQAKDILKKGLEKADSLYEKLPLDNLNKKLQDKNIPIDLRNNKIKIAIVAIVIALIALLGMLILGGDSIPNQSTVDKIVTEKHKFYNETKVTDISYENVQQISKNVYHTKAIITKKTTVTKDFAKTWGANVGDTWQETIMQDLVITYAGKVVEVEFGPATKVQ